ncbi:40S ribosomal protein S27-like [Clarias magur]|uniref:40S ribosomal protein S27 n=1 Tax=Clarias magur TaxID=1594786 RepID=A0A8J4U8D6_CLAMG|nr:40S ribosomal protein S27-like [Clarias magur]
MESPGRGDLTKCMATTELLHLRNPTPRAVYVGEKRLQKKMPLAKDLLNPTLDIERRQHKKKRLVQSPNSYFMDVKCPGCYKITTVFSHAQTVVLCVGCSTVLCQPTGGKARLTEGLRQSHKPLL